MSMSHSPEPAGWVMLTGMSCISNTGPLSSARVCVCVCVTKAWNSCWSVWSIDCLQCDRRMHPGFSTLAAGQVDFRSLCGSDVSESSTTFTFQQCKNPKTRLSVSDIRLSECNLPRLVWLRKYVWWICTVSFLSGVSIWGGETPCVLPQCILCWSWWRCAYLQDRWWKVSVALSSSW